MNCSSSWKPCAFGLLASVAIMACPTPALAGNDAGALVCLVSVLSGQTAARQVTPDQTPAARPDRFPAPDLTLSALPASSGARR